jgi:hypothetical protein
MIRVTFTISLADRHRTFDDQMRVIRAFGNAIREHEPRALGASFETGFHDERPKFAFELLSENMAEAVRRSAIVLTELPAFFDEISQVAVSLIADIAPDESAGPGEWF